MEKNLYKVTYVALIMLSMGCKEITSYDYIVAKSHKKAVKKFHVKYPKKKIKSMELFSENIIT